MCAAILDELRHGMASHYNHPTVYPIALHLGSLIDDYALPLEKHDVSESWDADETDLPTEEA
jgi:hypothetical protein